MPTRESQVGYARSEYPFWTSNVSNVLNDRYRADWLKCFEKNATKQAAAAQRLAMSDVKRSLLDFCSMAASYGVTLGKHFRCYPLDLGMAAHDTNLRHWAFPGQMPHECGPGDTS